MRTHGSDRPELRPASGCPLIAHTIGPRWVISWCLLGHEAQYSLFDHLSAGGRTIPDSGRPPQSSTGNVRRTGTLLYGIDHSGSRSSCSTVGSRSGGDGDDNSAFAGEEGRTAIDRVSADRCAGRAAYCSRDFSSSAMRASKPSSRVMISSRRCRTGSSSTSSSVSAGVR